MLETMLVSALFPAAIDLVKSIGGALSRRFVGVSIDDQIKLQQADISKLEALAKLDNPYGTPSQWVIDLRASFRYIGAAVCIAAGTWIIYEGVTLGNDGLVNTGIEFVSIPFSFIFGERLLLGLKGAAK